MATTKNDNVKETPKTTVEGKESTINTVPPKRPKEKDTEIRLKVQGKSDRIYQVTVEGKEVEVKTGDTVTVKTQEEADRLSELDDLSGGLLFNILGGNV